MWQTLKAEMEYNGIVVGIFGLLVVLAVCGAILLEGGNVNAVITNTSLTVLFVHLVMQKRRHREFYVRRATILPQSLSTTAWSRILTAAVLQSGVFVVWLLMYVSFHLPDDAGAIWRMLSSNAILMTVLVAMVAENDVCGSRDITKIAGSVVVGAVLCAAMLFSFANMGSYVLFRLDADMAAIVAYTDFLGRPLGALTANVALVGALYIGHQIYGRRRQYLK